MWAILTSGRTEFSFCSPPAAPVLIFDRQNEQILRDVLLPDTVYTVVDTRFTNERCRLYLSVGILARCLSNIAAGLKASEAYYLACIQVVAPKVLLDFTQDARLIPLVRQYGKAKLFVISNGFWNFVTRPDLLPEPQYPAQLAAMQLQGAECCHIFCWGQKDIEVFAEQGVTTDKTGIRFYAAGSLLGDYYKHECSGRWPERQEYDICLSSQAGSAHIKNNSDFCRLLMRCNDSLLSHLSRYLQESSMSCVVATRTFADDMESSAEVEYFKACLGPNPNVTICARTDYLSTYRLMAKSRVSLSVHSASGYEVIGWGKKVLFCPFEFFEVYKVSSGRFASDAEMWPWLLAYPDYETFARELDRLLALPDEQYTSQTGAVAQYIMNADSPVPAHSFIRERILATIADHEERTAKTL